jgi:hypothetical protein
MSLETTINWRCPFCYQNATITSDRRSTSAHRFDNGNKHGPQSFVSEVFVCPNSDCGEFSLTAHLSETRWNGKEVVDETPTRTWRLVPPAAMKRFPEYVPESVRQDYEEACLTHDVSPKASATMARRCLQTMIRDFWSLKKQNLHQEIDAIKDEVDPLTWQGIMAVKKIGNVSAHMTLANDVIVDVDPQEATLLIGLIETLVSDWYINRYERENRMRQLIDSANSKKSP